MFAAYYTFTLDIAVEAYYKLNILNRNSAYSHKLTKLTGSSKN